MTLTYDRAAAVSAAFLQVGWRYQPVDARHDGMTPGGVDCSGSTLLAARAGGVQLPHQSAQQTKADRVYTVGPGKYAKHLARFWLRPGDLVFYYGVWPAKWDAISHVAMYVGMRNGQRMIVNATNEARGVELIGLFEYAKPCAYGFIDGPPWPLKTPAKR